MGESEEFTFEARAPEEPGEYAWAATQTYEDGSTVEWSGPADSEKPAPTVRVVAGASETTSAGDQEHGEGDHEHGKGDQEHGAGAPEEPATDGGESLSPYLMAGAGVLAASAVVGLTLLRGRGRT